MKINLDNLKGIFKDIANFFSNLFIWFSIVFGGDISGKDLDDSFDAIDDAFDFLD